MVPRKNEKTSTHTHTKTVTTNTTHGDRAPLLSLYYSLYLQVTSWDTDSGKVQEDWGNERSFIRCISEELEDDPETCDGAAKNDMGECRMVSEPSKSQSAPRENLSK